MKKDQLIEENDRLKTRVAVLERSEDDDDEHKRYVLSDMLGRHFITRKTYGDDEESPLDWERIYFHLGKLIQRKDTEDREDEIQALEARLGELCHDVRELQNPDEDLRLNHFPTK